MDNIETAEVLRKLIKCEQLRGTCNSWSCEHCKYEYYVPNNVKVIALCNAIKALQKERGNLTHDYS